MLEDYRAIDARHSNLLLRIATYLSYQCSVPECMKVQGAAVTADPVL